MFTNNAYYRKRITMMAQPNNRNTHPYRHDVTLRNELLIEYIPFVKQTAQRIATHLPNSVEVDDLISAGTIGLIQAVERFDPTRGIQLKTFAAFRIKGAILSELRARDLLSRSNRKKVREMERTNAALEQKLGRTVKDGELTERLGIGIEELHKLRTIGALSVVSIEDIRGRSDAIRGNLLEYIADESIDDPLTLAGLKELKNAMAEAISALPEKEKLVVSLYYVEELNMKEVGEVLGVTESRISQLHSQAVQRLRRRLQLKGLIDKN